MHLIAALFDGNTGNGLVVETYLGRVEITNSRFVDNHGNGVKAKFLDGRFVIVDQLLTFCKMANIGTQSFPQLITGIPAFSTSCQRVRRLTDAGIALVSLSRSLRHIACTQCKNAACCCRCSVICVSSVRVCVWATIRYDTRCYFNVRSKADISQLNLPHGTDN